MEVSKASVKFNRNVNVSVRVSPSENKFLDFYCRKVGISKSTFLRMVSLREAKIFYNSFKTGNIIGSDDYSSSEPKKEKGYFEEEDDYNG